MLAVNEGDNVSFDKVLMVTNGDDVSIGKPYIEKATVAAKVLRHGRGDKIRIVKMRRRKNSRRITGHRQHSLKLKLPVFLHKLSFDFKRILQWHIKKRV